MDDFKTPTKEISEEKNILNENINNDEKMLNIEQKKIIKYLEKRIGKEQIKLLILGSAGSGKSFLINKIKEDFNHLKIITTAHLSIAAENIDGLSCCKLFTYFNYKAKIYISDKNGVKCFVLIKEEGSWKINNIFGKPKYIDQKRIFNDKPDSNLLIIDEISTVSLEMLDDFNKILQTVFNNKFVFGGLNVVFIGDLYQIPPINGVPLYETINDKKHFIYEFTLKELTKNMRQKDLDFFNLCQNIRNSNFTEKDKELLNSRSLENLKKTNKDLDISNIIHVLPTKEMCDRHNNEKMKKLKKFIYNFTCIENSYVKDFILSGKEDFQFYGLLKNLKICNEAKIMITLNFQDPITNKYYSNGELGFIKDIIKINSFEYKKYKEIISDIYSSVYDQNERINYLLRNKQTQEEKQEEKQDKTNSIKDYAILIFLNKKNIYILLHSNIKNITTKEKMRIYDREMFPIQLAWAITTHKSQGLTLEEGVIDLGEDNFESSMIYVSLTRMTSLDFVFIKNNFNFKKNKNISLIKKFRKKLILKNNKDKLEKKNKEINDKEINDE